MSTPVPEVMLDLETLDNSPTSLILSIGACKFHRTGTGIVGTTFEVFIDLEDAARHGLTMSAGTVDWWLHPDRDAARAELMNNKRNRLPLKEALLRFHTWMSGDRPVWGCGSDFDNLILSNAYKAADMKQPWSFWNNRCYRTMKSLHPGVKVERVGTHHSALQDAVTQALHLQAIIRSTHQE
jgi:hypothetical protein